MTDIQYLYDDNDLDCDRIEQVCLENEQDGYEIRIQVVKFKK